MGKSGFWFGYLKAGSKSSPMLRDPDLDTGNPKTVFLFNFERNAIIEYSREIVDSKLRQLSSKEKHLVPQLESAYRSARKSWSLRGARKAPAVSVRPPTPAEPSAANVTFDASDDDPAILLDDEIELLDNE